jgi:hypothetical protein
MVGALFDTNILIDYLNGVEAAKLELARYSDKAISLITWMEVMVGSVPETQQVMKRFLKGFTTVSIDHKIAECAVGLRQQHKIKLPDAIILATAHIQGRLLITRDSKDFLSDEPGVRIPY